MPRNETKENKFVDRKMIERKKQDQLVVMFVDNEGDLSSEEVKNNYQSNQNEPEETSVLRNPGLE